MINSFFSSEDVEDFKGVNTCTAFIGTVVRSVHSEDHTGLNNCALLSYLCSGLSQKHLIQGVPVVRTVLDTLNRALGKQNMYCKPCGMGPISEKQNEIQENEPHTASVTWSRSRTFLLSPSREVGAWVGWWCVLVVPKRSASVRAASKNARCSTSFL